MASWPVVNDITSLRSLPQYAREAPTAIDHRLVIPVGVEERYGELIKHLNGLALGTL